MDFELDFELDYETYYVEKKNYIDLSKCMNYDEGKPNTKLTIDFNKIDYTIPEISNPILDDGKNSDNVEFKNSE